MGFHRPEYTVRLMQPYDNDQVLEICAKVGLVIGNYTNITMMKIDPNSLYVAVDNETQKILGVCCGININSRLAFIGEYAVHPSYQKMGIGQALWRRVMEHTGDRNTCLYSSAKMITSYKEKCGFKVIPARKMVAYSGFPQIFTLNKYLTDCDIEYISGHNIGEVIEYDEEVCGINRNRFIELSVAEPGSVALLARYITNGHIAGYAIFKTTNFNSIMPRPLYADNDYIAEALTYNCIDKFVAYDGLYWQTWDVNEEANWLVTKLGLEKKYMSPVMFTRQDVPANNFKRIFAISPSDFYPY